MFSVLPVTRTLTCEEVVTQTLDSFIQSVEGSPGEMLRLYLRQGIKDEPVYVFANTRTAGETLSPNHV